MLTNVRVHLCVRVRVSVNTRSIQLQTKHKTHNELHTTVVLTSSVCVTRMLPPSRTYMGCTRQTRAIAAAAAA